MNYLIPLLSPVLLAAAPDAWRFEPQEIDPHIGNVCYAVTLADVNRDGKEDVVAVSETAVVWYENPSWHRRTVIDRQTERDNVCIAAHDIDGDGLVDFALGAAWQPTNTQSGGTLQWLRRGKSLDERWSVYPIAAEPTLHRLRWGDVLGNGRAQLVVSPLQGRGTKGPNWDQGRGVRLLVYSIPQDPAKEPWPVQVADDSLHTMHNHWITDLDGDGRNDILVASWHGVHCIRYGRDGHWSRQPLGAGNPVPPPPQKGSSEIKLGRLASGKPYLATIEPWHGFQVVAYTPPAAGTAGLWDRHVLDEALRGGHAVWTANLDSDADDEIIIGQRDQGKAPGVLVFDAKDASGTQWQRLAVDPGRIAVEDLVAGDLDDDGRIDIVAGGRATHNVMIFWNRTER
jgi:hypothetical protein